MQIVRGGFVLRFCLSSAFDYPARAMAKGRLNSERIWFRHIDAENAPAFIGNAVETFSGDAVAGSLANLFPRGMAAIFGNTLVKVGQAGKNPALRKRNHPKSAGATRPLAAWEEKRNPGWNLSKEQSPQQ